MKGRNLLISSLLIGSVCLGLVSCASIISGTKADIVLQGNIDEPVDIQTDYKLYTRQVLPTTVQVKRGKKASKIEMSSEDHDFNDILVSKDVNGWLWGNLAFGGIPGFIIDFADGAAWKPAEESFYVNATKKINSQTESASSRSMIMETFSDETVSVEDDDVDETVQHVSHSHTESSGSSFSEFLEDYIVRWEEKGEFETTEQWRNRVSKENINAKLPELSATAKLLFIEQEKEKLEYSVRLGKYDADNEVFVIHSDIKNIYVDVPLNIAPLFKEKWKEVEKQFEYDVKNDRISIKSALFKLDGKEYHTVKVIKEQSYHLESKSVNISNDFSQQQSSITTEPTHNVGYYQDANVRSKQANPFTAVGTMQEEPTNIMHSNGNLGLHSVRYIDERLVRFDINRLYYLDSENPDNLKYVDETFKEYIQANNIRTTNEIEKADAIITGHAIGVEGGLLYYLTVVDASSDLLWQSKPVASKKTNFKKSVKKAIRKSCKELTYAFNAKVQLPISSPLHYMHKRINAPEFTTPDYLVALGLYEAEDYKEALKGFDRVIEANPYFADAYFFRSIANCKKRDINEGKRDMMYFHTLRPYDERFDDGIKYVYYEIALRAERRARNAQIAANVMNAVAVGTAGVATALNNSKASTITTPVVNTSSSVRSTTTTPKTICSICHGTGKNPSPSTVAQYGQITYQYCDICMKTGTPHYHKVCFKCKGKGYASY